MSENIMNSKVFGSELGPAGGSFWARFGTHFGLILGPILGSFWGSFRAHFGAHSGAQLGGLPYRLQIRLSALKASDPKP